MTDEQIRLLVSLGSDEAWLLLRNGDRALYRRIQTKMLAIVRDHDVKLPLNCLLFMYYANGLLRTSKTTEWGRRPAIH